MQIQRISRVLLVATALGALGCAQAAMAACVSTFTRQCLVNGRFAVEATWPGADNKQTPGQVIFLGQNAAGFWFLSKENPELVVKIIDGQSVNQFFWVFYAGLTSRHVTLKVTDTKTGHFKIYNSPAGTLASQADTRAFRKSASLTETGDWMTFVSPQASPDYSWCKPGQASDFVADFTYNEPFSGKPVNFTDKSSGSPDRWCWIFGDEVVSGCSAATQDVPHIYASAGTYTVAHWVGRPNGPSVQGACVTKTFTVSDPPPCTFDLSLNPNPASFPAAGGSGTVTLKASAQDCSWTAESSPFIYLTPTGGVGNDTINFRVLLNHGSTMRTGNLTVKGPTGEGQTFTITQAGPPQPCTYSFSPPSVDPVDPSGGIGSVSVQTRADCTWTAKTSTPSFVRLLGAASGQGSGKFDYYVAANRGADRTGVIAIANGSVEIHQPGFNLLGACQPTVTSLCLLENRFEVRVAFRLSGNNGVAQSVQLDQSYGYFTFFDPTNPEIVLKMLDGRPVNGHFWLFYGALSNVDYVVTATDTTTGETQFYCNPNGTFKSVGDALAFPSP